MKKILKLYLNGGYKSIATMLLFFIAVTLLLVACENTDRQTYRFASSSSNEIEHGKYLVKIQGCNDCHTAGFAESSGNVPEKDWLLGTPVGFRGPWGTTYPSNLRLFAQNLTEEQWLKVAHKRNSMPPMPWVILKSMNNNDLIAMYRYIKSLGPAGEMAPTYVPPDQEPNTPYIVFEPVHMERLVSITK